MAKFRYQTEETTGVAINSRLRTGLATGLKKKSAVVSAEPLPVHQCLFCGEVAAVDIEATWRNGGSSSFVVQGMFACAVHGDEEGLHERLLEWAERKEMS